MKKCNVLESAQKLITQKIQQKNVSCVGVGVSGGSDSMVLLSILIELSKTLGIKLFVLNVNHNMREKSLSKSDSDFVMDFCKQNNVYAEVKTLEDGFLAEIARKRGKGTEEAARFLRYEFFLSFIEQHKIDLFCLGHNKSDQLETLLQRFLQGNSVLSSKGIFLERNVFFRPLLNVSKKQIEEYAEQKNIPFVFDQTNDETSYFRNRIRQKIVPILDNSFEGWQTSVLHGAEKAKDVADFIDSYCKKFVWHKNESNCLEMSLSCFEENQVFIKIAILQKAFRLLDFDERISYSELKKIVLSKKNFLQIEDISICKKKGLISISRSKKKSNVENFGFCFFVQDEGVLELKNPLTNQILQIEIINQDKIDLENKNQKLVGPFPFPFVLRNRQLADKIECADGSFMQLSKVFSNWKVGDENRNFILVIEASNVVCGVVADYAGYKNWVVKQKENVLLSAKKNVYVTTRIL